MDLALGLAVVARRLNGYNEFQAYSPLVDCVMARISLTDANNEEFYMMIPAEPAGRTYREARAKAVAAIEDAIRMGLAPGEVRLR